MKNLTLSLFLLFYVAALAQSQNPVEAPKSNPQPAMAEEGKVCIYGAVSKPLELSFRKGLTISQAIEAAGGILPNSRDIEVVVYSETTDGVRRTIYVDLKAIKKRPYKDLRLQSYDVVFVSGDVKRVTKLTANPCPSLEGLRRVERM